jgi:hypothetical protein
VILHPNWKKNVGCHCILFSPSKMHKVDFAAKVQVITNIKEKKLPSLEMY